jgi:hypothetical protein
MRIPAQSLVAASLLALPLAAETVKDRKGAVLGDRAAMESNDRWIYNDWQKGFEMARETGKPLLVVLRCVPCLACMGMDAAVLGDPGLRPLLDRFICVRVINANALDLSLFQFDYDLSFSTVFFNADGTVYGRYGSWKHQKDSYDQTTSGYQAALEGALDLHAGYPANKKALEGKQGLPLPVSDPLQLPALAGKYKRQLDWEGQVVQSCVHCHQVGDAVRSMHRQKSGKIPQQWIYPMPMPETIGLVLAPDSAAHVSAVAADSIAAKAGLKPGDALLALDGQPLLSVADVSWALHRTPDAASMQARVRRAGKELSLRLELAEGWRSKSDISRRVGAWPMRAMALGGLQLEDLGPDARAERGIGPKSMALLVKHAGEYGEHAAAKKAGFRKDDLIVSVDGGSARLTESELIGRLLEKQPPRRKVKATVLRGAERLELEYPTQ